MGSLMSTMKASATLTILLSVLSSFSLIHCSQPLRWKQAANGRIPRHAVKVFSRNKTPHYPCRVSTSSQVSYGVLSGEEGTCKFADTDQKHILSSSSFDVLVGDQSRVALKWVGSRPTGAEMRQSGAIPCNLNTGTSSDCYFGEGVYSDGICDEEVGVVIPSKGRVFMVDPYYTPDRVSVCGAFRFIV